MAVLPAEPKSNSRRFVPASEGNTRDQANGVGSGTGIRMDDGWLLIRTGFGLELGEFGESAE
jgi:hypothetical protein